jgi:hypothetical protein
MGERIMNENIKMPLFKLISGFSLILLTSAILYGLFQARQTGTRRLQPGQPMPGFQLSDETGAPLTDHSFAGRNYGLLFFRTDCGHCQQELTDIDQLLPQFDGRLPLLALSLNSPEETRRAREQWRLLTPTYLAPVELTRSLRVRSVPLLILVGADGRIAYVQSGERSRRYLNMVFERFLQGESLAEAELRKLARQLTASNSTNATGDIGDGCVLSKEP